VAVGNGVCVQVGVFVGTLEVDVRVGVLATGAVGVGDTCGVGGGEPVALGIHIMASNQTFLPLSPVQSLSDTDELTPPLKRNLPRFAQLPEPTSVIAPWLMVTTCSPPAPKT
jgi:hypothetical protein